MIQFNARNRVSTTKASLIMAGLGVLMLAFAFGSQHLYDFQPCTMCIEIRFWISAAIIVALASAILGFLTRWGSRIAQMATVGLYAASAVEAIRLSMIEKGYLFSGCTPFTFYQEYLPLESWWPSMFEVQGLCGNPVMLFDEFAYSDASAVGLIGATLISLIIWIRSLKGW